MTIIARFLLGATLLATSVSCTSIDGGAIEIRWVINDVNGIRIGCDQAGFDMVRLFLDPATSCGGDTCLFDCAKKVAITEFDIPTGTYEIWIRPRDAATGEILDLEDGLSAPAKVVRDVTVGQVTDLGVHLFTLDHAVVF